MLNQSVIMVIRSLGLYKRSNLTRISTRNLAGSKSLADPYRQFALETYRWEGIEDSDPLCVFDRKNVFKKIEGKLMVAKVVLVKAPPRSCKTSTVRLIKRNALHIKSYDRVLCLSGETGLDQQISSQLSPNGPKSFADLLSATGRTLVLIDQGQRIYDKAFPNYVSLWRDLKDLMSNKKNPLDVVVFASYGEKSDCEVMPGGMSIEFEDRNTIYFNDLSFTKSETQEMIDRWNSMKPPARPFLGSNGVDLVVEKMSDVVPLTSTLTNTIFTLTMGHVGLTRLLVEEISERFLDSERNFVPSYPVSEGDVMAFLLSDALQHAVRQTRAVPSGWEQRDQEAVRRILMEGSVNQRRNQDLKDSFSRLKKIGLVADSGIEVMFSSPLLAMQAINTIFGTVSGRPTEMPQFEGFLFNAVSLMSHDLLRRKQVCKVDAKGKLHKTLEMQLLMEWYMAAIRLLPMPCVPIVNYGRYHPTASDQGEELDGLMDFYLNGKHKLGVELVRNCVDLEERIKRFEVGGKYTGIPLIQWRVVNFVEVSGEPKNHAQEQKEKESVLDGELRVLWSPDCVDFVAMDSTGEKKGKFVTEAERSHTSVAKKWLLRLASLL